MSLSTGETHATERYDVIALGIDAGRATQPPDPGDVFDATDEFK